MPGESAAEVEIVNNEAASRYEARLDGEVLGFSAYRLRGDKVVFTHTEVDSAAEGKGVGSAIAEAALADVRRRGLAVVPLCPFIASYIARHADDYLDLVPEDYHEGLRQGS